MLYDNDNFNVDAFVDNYYVDNDIVYGIYEDVDVDVDVDIDTDTE